MRQEDTMSLMALAAASDPQLQGRLAQQATAMDRMRDAARALNTEMKQTYESVDRLAMFASYGFIQMYSQQFRNWAASITETSAALEQLNVRYTHFTNAAQAQQAITGLRRAAIRTPFEYMPVMETAGRFLGLWAGRPALLQSESINQAVLASAQVASATGATPDQAALTLARMRVPGQRWQRLETGRVLATQLRSAGVMAESSGPELYASALQVIQRNYGGLMQEQANTFSGVVSNLKDALTDIKAGVGGDIVPGMKTIDLLSGGAVAARGAAAVAGKALSTPPGQVLALMTGIGAAATSAAAGLMTLRLAISQITGVMQRDPQMAAAMNRNIYRGVGIMGVGLPMVLAGSAAGRAGGQWLAERFGADEDAQMAWQQYGALAGAIGMGVAAGPAARFMQGRYIAPLQRGAHAKVLEAIASHEDVAYTDAMLRRAGRWGPVGIKPNYATEELAAFQRAAESWEATGGGVITQRGILSSLESGQYGAAARAASTMRGTSAGAVATREAAQALETAVFVSAMQARGGGVADDLGAMRSRIGDYPATPADVSPFTAAKEWWGQRVDAGRAGAAAGRGAYDRFAGRVRGWEGWSWKPGQGRGLHPTASGWYESLMPYEQAALRAEAIGGMTRPTRGMQRQFQRLGELAEAWTPGFHGAERTALLDALAHPRGYSRAFEIAQGLRGAPGAAGLAGVADTIEAMAIGRATGLQGIGGRALFGTQRGLEAVPGLFRQGVVEAGRGLVGAGRGVLAGISALGDVSWAGLPSAALGGLRTAGVGVGRGLLATGRGLVGGLGVAAGGVSAGAGAIYGFLGPLGSAALAASAALMLLTHSAQQAQNAEERASRAGGRPFSRLAGDIVSILGTETLGNANLDYGGVWSTYRGGPEMFGVQLGGKGVRGSLEEIYESLPTSAQERWDTQEQMLKDRGFSQRTVDTAFGKVIKDANDKRIERELEVAARLSEGILPDEVMEASAGFTGVRGMEIFGTGGLIARPGQRQGILPSVRRLNKQGQWLFEHTPGEFTTWTMAPTSEMRYFAEEGAAISARPMLEMQEANARRKRDKAMELLMAGKDETGKDTDVDTETLRQLAAARTALSNRGQSMEDLLMGKVDFSQFTSEEQQDLGTALAELSSNETISASQKDVENTMKASAANEQNRLQAALGRIKAKHIAPAMHARAMFEAEYTPSSFGGIMSGEYARQYEAKLDNQITSLNAARSALIKEGFGPGSDEILQLDLQIAQAKSERRRLPAEQAGRVASLQQVGLAGVEATRTFAEGDISGFFSRWTDQAQKSVEALRVHAEKLEGIDEIQAEQIRLEADKVDMAISLADVDKARMIAGVSGAYTGFMGAVPYANGAMVGQAMFGHAGNLLNLAQQQFGAQQISAGWTTMGQWAGAHYGGRQAVLEQGQLENQYRNVLFTSTLGTNEYDTLQKQVSDAATAKTNAKLAYEDAYEGIMDFAEMTESEPNYAKLAPHAEALAEARRRERTASQALSAYSKSVGPRVPYARIMTGIGRESIGSAREQAGLRLYAQRRAPDAGGVMSEYTTYYGAAQKMLDLEEAGMREQYADDDVRLALELNSIMEKRVGLWEKELADIRLVKSETLDWLNANVAVYDQLSSIYGWTPTQRRSVLALGVAAAQEGLQRVYADPMTKNDPIAIAKAQGAVQAAMAQEFMSRSKDEPEYGASLMGARLSAQQAWMGVTPAGQRRLELGWNAWSPEMRQSALGQAAFLQQGAQNALARGPAGAMDYLNIQQQMAGLAKSMRPTRDPLDQLLGQYLNAGQDQFRGVAAEMMRTGMSVSGVHKSQFEILLKLDTNSMLAYMAGASMGDVVVSQLVEYLNSAQ